MSLKSDFQGINVPLPFLFKKPPSLCQVCGEFLLVPFIKSLLQSFINKTIYKDFLMMITRILLTINVHDFFAVNRGRIIWSLVKWQTLKNGFTLHFNHSPPSNEWDYILMENSAMKKVSSIFFPSIFLQK